MKTQIIMKKIILKTILLFAVFLVAIVLVVLAMISLLMMRDAESTSKVDELDSSETAMNTA